MVARRAYSTFSSSFSRSRDQLAKGGQASRRRRGCADAGPFALFPALAPFLLPPAGPRLLSTPCPRGCPERASAVEWGLESELTCQRRAREVRAEGRWSKGFYEGILEHFGDVARWFGIRHREAPFWLPLTKCALQRQTYGFLTSSFSHILPPIPILFLEPGTIAGRVDLRKYRSHLGMQKLLPYRIRFPNPVALILGSWHHHHHQASKQLEVRAPLSAYCQSLAHAVPVASLSGEVPQCFWTM